MVEEEIGTVTNFFQKINVAVIDLERSVSVGDSVHFKGAHTDFEQEIISMEINRESIEKAEGGQKIAIKVVQRVRPNDTMYRSGIP